MDGVRRYDSGKRANGSPERGVETPVVECVSVRRRSLPANCEPIEVHVSELKQLFNAIDPSPFRERDLDPDAEEFITDWAQEDSPSATFGLALYVDRPAGLPNEAAELREAIHDFFRHRAEVSRHRLRELFRRGRTSLVIGLCAFGVSVAGGNLFGSLLTNHLADILKESLLIGGWVAMWRLYSAQNTESQQDR